MLKLHIVQAEFGDCLLLEYGSHENPKFILIDGGPHEIYSTHLKGELERVQQAGGQLDLVVLSHVDEDHVLGLLDLLADLRQQRSSEQPELVKIGALWHNTFSETVGRDVEARFRALKSDRSLARAALPVTDMKDRSIAQGDDLTRAAGLLGVPINPHFSPNNLICVEDTPLPIQLENLSLQIVGPSRKQLEKLREKWLAWLEKQQRALMAETPEEAGRVARALDRSVPNLSSIMFLVEADGKKILLTGDGRGDHLLEGLEQAGLLDDEGRLHVDVFKLPHHGSSRNASEKLFRSIIAGQYVISANGRDGNPDMKTLRWLVTAAREQGRQIEILVTNETETTQQFRATHDPEEWGYRWASLEPGSHAVTIDLGGGTKDERQTTDDGPPTTAFTNYLC